MEGMYLAGAGGDSSHPLGMVQVYLQHKLREGDDQLELWLVVDWRSRRCEPLPKAVAHFHQPEQLARSARQGVRAGSLDDNFVCAGKHDLSGPLRV